MPAAFDGYVEKPARVSSTGLVSVARNRYPVPCEWAGQMVSTQLYPGRVVVVAGDAVVAEHERLVSESHLQTHVGTITCSNSKTASVDTGDVSWSVLYSKLRRVLDI